MDDKPWYHGDRFSMNQRNTQTMYAYEELIIVFHRRSDKQRLCLQPSDRDKVFCHEKEELDSVRHGAAKKTRENMKPASLIADLVSTYEMTGNGIVLDFCMGKGGSSCIGTLSAGRRFIGAELDTCRFRNACKRIEVSTTTQNPLTPCPFSCSPLPSCLSVHTGRED